MSAEKLDKDKTRKFPFGCILKILGAAFALFVLFELFFPCTNCIYDQARKSMAHEMIKDIDDASREYAKDYYDEYPKGNSSRIIATLMGKNPRGRTYLTGPMKNDFNESGDLLDPWMTPYRFIHVSDDQPTQVISAGPDKIFGTPDDVTIKEPSYTPEAPVRRDSI